MYFYVDESGHTGANIFDDAQPIMYYGVLSSQLNVDDVARNAVTELREILGVKRLHANELGMGRLVEISKGLIHLQENLDMRFDFHTLYKRDHALICFFDQVFDPGVNSAVPWSSYLSPLRYILLLKVAHLFDIETLKKAWSARIQINEELATKELLDVCKTILERIEVIPDKRSRQIISDALVWVLENPQEVQYNPKSKRDSYWITPNLIGFQQVMFSIALRIKEGKSHFPVIVVDQQTQFNKTQCSLAKFYAQLSGRQYDLGTGLPKMDFTGMPITPIRFQSGLNNVGLELVDIYLWLFKILFEKKEIAPELHSLLSSLMSSCTYNEISLSAIEKRWTEWFENLPEPTPEQWEFGKEIIKNNERRRLDAIATSKNRQKLRSGLK